MNPGDIVKWRVGSTWSRRQVFGTVTRVTPKGSVFAREFKQRDDSPDYKFTSGKGVELATPFEKARVDWNAQRPRTQHVRVRYALGAEDDAAPHGIVVLDNLGCVDARAAAAELLKLAEWLDAMPQDRPTDIAPSQVA